MATAVTFSRLPVGLVPGGIGYLEVLFFFALLLVLFGPSRLPGIARTLGHWMEQVRRAAALFQHNLLALEDECDADASPEQRTADQPHEKPEPSSETDESAH